ncbi:MAG: hypothetical protein ACLR56_15535 [Oscillospiraceae bacterium]
MKLSEIHIRDPFILPFEGYTCSPGKYAGRERRALVSYIRRPKNWSSR